MYVLWLTVLYLQCTCIHAMAGHQYVPELYLVNTVAELGYAMYMTCTYVKLYAWLWRVLVLLWNHVFHYS